jgi:hypothetical protein
MSFFNPSMFTLAAKRTAARSNAAYANKTMQSNAGMRAAKADPKDIQAIRNVAANLDTKGFKAAAKELRIREYRTRFPVIYMDSHFEVLYSQLLFVMYRMFKELDQDPERLGKQASLTVYNVLDFARKNKIAVTDLIEFKRALKIYRQS